jgi:hypothetical protein
VPRILPRGKPVVKALYGILAMMTHILLVMARAVAAVGVLYSLPYSHMKYGEPYPGDGQQAFGFIVAFFLIGFVAAAAYFALACTFHFLLRKVRRRYVLTSDGVLFTAFVSVLTYAGVTATYN